MTTTTDGPVLASETDEELREAAIKRLKAKHDFKAHLLLYLAVNAMLTVIWVTTNAGKPYPQGFFWPVFVMAGWGVAIVMNAYAVYRRDPLTENRIAAEMRNLERNGR